jgi:hypothetical protein
MSGKHLTCNSIWKKGSGWLTYSAGELCVTYKRVGIKFCLQEYPLWIFNKMRD